MDGIERAISQKTKKGFYAKALEEGVTHFKKWQHAWERYESWYRLAKSTRAKGKGTGGGTVYILGQ
jgi:hypothetical protein